MATGDCPSQQDPDPAKSLGVGHWASVWHPAEAYWVVEACLEGLSPVQMGDLD